MPKYKVTLRRPATVSWTEEIEADDASEAEQIMLDRDIAEELQEDASMEVFPDYGNDPDIVAESL